MKHLQPQHVRPAQAGQTFDANWPAGRGRRAGAGAGHQAAGRPGLCVFLDAMSRGEQLPLTERVADAGDPISAVYAKVLTCPLGPRPQVAQDSRPDPAGPPSVLTTPYTLITRLHNTELGPMTYAAPTTKKPIAQSRFSAAIA